MLMLCKKANTDTFLSLHILQKFKIFNFDMEYNISSSDKLNFNIYNNTMDHTF